MDIMRRKFGVMGDGGTVYAYGLNNSHGVSLEILNYGGTVLSVNVPDRDGIFKDVVLGYDNLEDYTYHNKFFGAIIGRYANRIEDGVFELGGKSFQLAKNDGPNHLHGGHKGFDKVLWNSEIIDGEYGKALKLTYLSEDGEENYPGNLDVSVTYSLSEDDELIIDYYAVSDRDTIVNLSNHSYFNLLGHDAGDIKGHRLKIYGHSFTAINRDCLTTGEILDVAETPFDFTEFTAIGKGIDSDHEQIVKGGGYDHNWVLDKDGEGARLGAELHEPTTGRLMQVYTTKPGIQFYSGNFLDGQLAGKEGAIYHKRSGVCLETQYFPNSLRHNHFPSPILKKGQEYSHRTIYKFGIL